MRTKKRKTNDSQNTASKRNTRQKVKEDEYEQSETKTLSLPTLSEEKVNFDDQIKTLPLKVDEKNPKIVLSKVKITCAPLNVEKIIEFDSSATVLNEVEKTKSNPEKKTKKGKQSKNKKSKNTGNEIDTPSNKNFSHIEPSTQRATKTKINVQKMKKKEDTADTSLLTCTEKGMSTDSIIKRSTEILENVPQQNHKRQLVFNLSDTKEKDLKSQSFQISPNQNFKKHSNNDLGKEAESSREISDNLSLYDMDDASAFIELNDINLEGLSPKLEDSDEAFEIRNENGLDVNNTITSNVSLNFTNSSYLRSNDLYELEGVRNNFNSQSKTSLQAAVEYFLSNSQMKCSKDIFALKKGLCLTWLSNNYVCANQQCSYSHCVRFLNSSILEFIARAPYQNHRYIIHGMEVPFNVLKSEAQIKAVKLFTKKLKCYPSRFILNVVVSMTNDTLFVDVIMAAFKILSSRKIPKVWVTFLIYFVFYATEPSDSRFLKFWANAARFYCQLSNEYMAANGFASLLSVFSKAEKSEEWKIIEFIKLIKRPPIQVNITYELLQPVLKLNLPTQFLIEAVESCIATQKDVLKVYLWVLPKISIMTSPIQTIELIFKFSKILEALDLNMHAEDLKRKLRAKVKTFKTKITHYDYPLTAAFQEDLYLNPGENDSLNISENRTDLKKQSENMPLEAVNRENNYFELENDFYSLMVQSLELTCSAVPNAVKVQSLLSTKNNESQKDDVCERQIRRVQQFFCDCQFDLLGKYLNDIRPNILDEAAEEFLKSLFQMKISLQQGVDLIRIILSQCKTPKAAKIIASVSITFIINLIRINEWKKAYTIVCFCEDKQINLIEGKVFYFNEFNNISQCRIVLLLIEINAYNGNYQRAMKLIKNHFLFSSNSSLWKLSWKQYDESIRIRIIEDFLERVILEQLTETVYELFITIWTEQKQLKGVIDLRKFVNEVIIVLLNEGNEEAVTLYEKVKSEIQLNDITVRAILVTLVRLNRSLAAKNILISTTQNVYSFSQIVSETATIIISSFWLEEEIYTIFDAFLELLAAKKRALISSEFENLEITIQIVKPNLISTPRITPLCLGIINPSFKDTCNRIQRVLYQFSPPLKLIVMPYYLKLDEYSLQLNLYNRIQKSFKNY